MTDFKKRALVLGAGGFIGSHMVKRLLSEGYWVRGVDLKYPDFSETRCNEFIVGDLRDTSFVSRVIRFNGYLGNFYNSIPDYAVDGFDEIYQFAADMGGAGFVFTGENDADIMHNSVSINLNVLEEQRKLKSFLDKYEKETETKIFYSSSACMYPEYNQLDPDNPDCREDSAYPADPDSEYGWEKLFSERLYLAYKKNYNMDICIARYHNIFGPEGTWKGGREKAPAAICRKVCELPLEGGEIEVWGDGKQTRSFLYIDECIEATRRLMKHTKFFGPVNIGSEEMVTIDQLVEIASKVENKKVIINHIDGPVGVRGRNSNNDLIKKELNWNYSFPLEDGITITYNWIKQQIKDENDE
jgi:nucleoside-diphosphate-sugar epimerase